MYRAAKIFGIAFLCTCILTPVPCAAHAKVRHAVEDTAKDILEIAGAQIIAGMLAPLFGLGPKKTEEEKQQEKTPVRTPDKKQDRQSSDQVSEDDQASTRATAPEPPKVPPYENNPAWARKLTGQMNRLLLALCLWQTGRCVRSAPI